MSRLVEQDVWARRQVAAAGKGGDTMWRAVGAVLTQFDGLLRGYNDRVAAAAMATATATEAERASHALTESKRRLLHDEFPATEDGDANFESSSSGTSRQGRSTSSSASSSSNEAGPYHDGDPEPGKAAQHRWMQIKALSRRDLLMLSAVGEASISKTWMRGWIPLLYLPPLLCLFPLL